MWLKQNKKSKKIGVQILIQTSATPYNFQKVETFNASFNAKTSKATRLPPLNH